MMLALIGFNANASMYIVGTDPMGNGWSPNSGIEMTDNGDGTYSYDVTINGDVWFCFAEALDSSWDVFNGQYRYGPKKNGANEIISAGQWTTTQKQGNGNGSYQFRGSNEKYTVTFDLNNLQFKIDGYVAPVVYESFTVAGNNTAIFGTEWDVTNTDNDMTLDATDNLYKLVKENVEIEAGTLFYKVVANHAWGESWGDPDGPDQNQNYVFNENGTYNLTFKFDFATKEVSLDAQLVQEGPEIDPYTGHLYIVGQVNDNAWNPVTAIEMVNSGDDDTFTMTNVQIIDSGDGFGYFSFMATRNESGWPADGYRIGAEEDRTPAVVDEFVDMGGFGTTGAFMVEPGYYNITVVLSGGENGLLKLTAGQAPEPVVDDVYIFGDVDNLAWDPTQGVKMTYNEGVYTAEVNATKRDDQEKAYIGFTKKLADAESETPWTDIEGFRFGPESQGAFVMTEDLLGAELALATDGSHESIALPDGTWTVTVDLESHIFTVNGTWPTDTVVPPVVTVYTVVGPEAIFGSEWDATDTNNDMTLADGIYTWSKQNVELTQNFDFKVVGNHDYAVYEWPMGFGVNWIANVEEPGIYTIDITFDPEAADSVRINCVLTKTGDIEPVHYDGDVYIMGEVNDNGGWFTNVGVQMTRDAENNLYTATITTAGENIPEGEEVGYSYFSFTKQLVEAADDWDGIAPYRFGAVSEGDYWVTDETLGTEIDLTNGGASFRVPAGKWNLTLSVDRMKLVIEKVEAERGDVNMDGNINISDVTALIDYLLTHDGSAIDPDAANTNLDENIGIGDVTTLIDYLLVHQW